jgi:hypothetical protein
MYEMGRSNPDMELDYMEHHGPYTMTPVEEIKPSASDCPKDTELEYPTLKQDITLNQSALDQNQNKKPRPLQLTDTSKDIGIKQTRISGRQYDSSIDVISSQATLVD